MPHAKRLPCGAGVDVPTFQSPIHYFPPEILADIFLCCLPNSQLPRPNRREAPLLVSQVSSLFRSTALSTPALWSGIKLNFIRVRKKQRLTLRLWISRSRSAPLSFSFKHLKNESNVAIDVLISILAPHSQRWKSVDITFYQDCVSSVFIEAVARGVPNLEHLTIGGSRKGQLGSECLVLSSAHRLKELDISVLILIDVGLSSLTSLKRICFHEHTTSMSSRRSLYLLDSCPSIEEFKICLRDTSSDLGAFDHQVQIQHLPFLRDLIIFATEGHPGPLFDHLCAPNLRKLTFYGRRRAFSNPIHSPHHASWTSMVQMFKRSNPPLQELRLDGHCMSKADLIECLQCLPRLRYLECVDDYRAGMMVEVLQLTPANTLCLELEEVVLSGEVLHLSGHLSAFVAMVSSRWGGRQSELAYRRVDGRCLKMVIVDFGDVTPEMIREEPTLARFLSEGLEIRLIKWG